jgi:3-mercaptopyruvate sulfurtransferase SseA
VLASRAVVSARVYDGGMIEWSADERAPLAVGSA